MNTEDSTHSQENEPRLHYNRITFSTVETQWDIQLLHSLTLSTAEKLRYMRLLNEQAFGKHKEDLTKEKRIIFTSYEYTV